MDERNIEEYLVGSHNESIGHSRLPRDVFHNWFQYEVVRHKFYFAVAVIQVILFIISTHNFFQAQKNANKILTITGAVYLSSVVIYFTGLIFFQVERGFVTTAANKVQFLKELITIRPGIDMIEWDILATKANTIFYNESVLTSPYYFYDGASCYSFFRFIFLLPYLRRKEACFADENSPDEIRRFISQAIKVYQEKADRKWQLILNKILSGRTNTSRWHSNFCFKN